MFGEIQGKYDPLKFEKKIYDFWVENKYFHGEIDRSKTPFSIVIPPPNITGRLHMGHALNNTLQDIVIRYKRMKGFGTVWIPGTDHAGIATQNVVERALEAENKNRFELGREKFVEEAWKWKEEYGSRIISQLKFIGCSCDWDRERFTLDEGYSRAVTREFVTLYNEGLIYRGNYMINWCPRCQTAISDIEVERTDKDGSLWDIKYPLIDKDTNKPSTTEFLVVSTTRPETMLGDTAVAVNPGDPRYRKLKGRMVLLPLMERKIPVIEDDFVDMEFGSGAVKVTPSHDPNDFEIGRRHKLEEINILNIDATLNSNAGKYEGLEVSAGRKAVLKDLQSGGHLLGKKDHVSSVGACSRCSTIIEPRVSTQWFVSMKKLADPAITAVREGRVKIIPKKWEKIYFNWMENIRDWCISRQLWWGHRIPVWYCGDCSGMTVSETEPGKCAKCGSHALEQDKDVLDTWFSSCLWPFATLGWPEDTDDLKYYFPTSVLITGHDIIFFWVARMIMMGLHYKDDVPFKEVFINPLVNDPSGQKMSKSKGNVVDPMTIIDKNGADVLRFTLASLTTPGRDLLLGDEKIEGIRNFANKLWNASKFVLSNLADFENIEGTSIEKKDLNIWDRWILSRLARTIQGVEKHIGSYNFSFAARLLLGFFWNDYCDWFIESAKVRVYFAEKEDDKKAALFVLWKVLEEYLKLLHPFMPFITENIWQNIPHSGDSIMTSKYPVFDPDSIDSKAEEDLEAVFNIISEVRKIRSELKVPPSGKVKICIDIGVGPKKEILVQNMDFIYNLAKVSQAEFGDPGGQKGYIKTSTGDIDIFIYILDVIDIDLEIGRIQDEIKKVSLEVKKRQKKISNAGFLKKAPAEVIQKEKDKLGQAGKILEVLDEQLLKIKNIKKQ